MDVAVLVMLAWSLILENVYDVKIIYLLEYLELLGMITSKYLNKYGV